MPEKWRSRNSFGYTSRDDVIMPQHAIERLYELTKDRDPFITTEVSQYQMWAAQHFHFEQPNRRMTQTEDISFVLRTIIDAGGTLIGEITDFGTADKPFLIAYARDPEGNVLELEQP